MEDLEILFLDVYLIYKHIPRKCVKTEMIRPQLSDQNTKKGDTRELISVGKMKEMKEEDTLNLFDVMGSASN